MNDTPSASTARLTGRRPPRPLYAALAPGRLVPLRRARRHVQGPRRGSSPAAAAWSRRPPTTCASSRCSGAADSWTACGSWGRGRSPTWRRNYLPGGADLDTFGRPLFAETPSAASASAWASASSSTRHGQGARVGRRLFVGRCREHQLLGGPGRGPLRGVSDPGVPVQRATGPGGAPPARQPGHRGVSRGASTVFACCSPTATSEPRSTQVASCSSRRQGDGAALERRRPARPVLPAVRQPQVPGDRPGARAARPDPAGGGFLRDPFVLHPGEFVLASTYER